MVQANGSLFSIYPIEIVGYYCLKAAFVKEFYFLKPFNFFTFLWLIGTRITLILYDVRGSENKKSYLIINNLRHLRAIWY